MTHAKGPWQTTMKILCVTDKKPLPLDTGGRARFHNLLVALRDLGSVDLLVCRRLKPAEKASIGEALGVSRIGSEYPRRIRWLRGRLRWLLHRDLPSNIACKDLAKLHRFFRRWAADHYDLAWFYGAPSYLAVRDLVHAPCVVDFADLEDVVRDRQLAVLDRARWQERLRLRLDRSRWARLQRRIAREAKCVVVCSEHDRERLGDPRVRVIANGYEPPERPLGRLEVGDPPTLLFPGTMKYAPNADGARHFVNEIPPRIHQRLPDARLRIVGRANAEVDALASNPGVTVTGPVPHIEDELARADAIVVPLRAGSGTRIKLLEAFAHRIPTVSTTIGSEGLDVENGRELLLADAPQEFADACVRLLTDVELRAAVVKAAQEKYRTRHRWPYIRSRFADLVRDLDAVTADSPHQEAAGRSDRPSR